MQKHTLYGRTRTGAIKVWSTWADEATATVYRQWGVLHGAMMQTSEKMTTRGKPGTKAFKTERQVMIEQMQRIILDKKEEGFVEDVKDVRTDVQADGDYINFASLPATFMPAKPKNSIERDKLVEWESKDLIYIQRKRDGQRVWITNNEKGEINIFTRNHERITENLPGLVSAIMALQLPFMTMLDGELIVEHPDGSDNFRALGALTRAKPDKARVAERDSQPRILVFDVLYYDSEETFRLPYAQRYEILERLNIVPQGRSYLFLPEHFSSLVAAEEAVANSVTLIQKWEGLVVWRKDEASRIHLNGKEWRGNCYKHKPFKTGDFVATGWEPGKGRLEDSVGALFIAEYVDGKLTELCTSGSGLTDDVRTEIKSGKWKFPITVELEYDRQEPDSGALRFPVFVRFRPDKPTKECKRGSNEE